MKPGRRILTAVAITLLAISCDQQPTVSTTRGIARVECDESLFPVMQLQAEDFHNTYPEGRINILSVEAREAVVNFVNDSIRVITLGRPFNAEELGYLKNANIEYEGYKVALDAIVVILNKQHADSMLRITELDSIFSGTLTRWNTPKKPLIDAFVGSINSSTDEVFRTVILEGRPFGQTVTRINSSEKMVEEVKTNPHAIGLVGLSWLRGHDGEVRVCRLGGGTYRPVVRAKAVIEGTRGNQQRIVITELPLQMDKPAFMERIRDLVGNKMLNNVSAIRDESEGSGIHIVLALETQADAYEVLNSLQRQTQMADTTLVPGQFFSPAQAHVLRKYYPLSREVYMYTREVRRDVSYGFIAYVKDRKGQQNFLNHGLVPAAQPVRIVGLTSDKVHQ
jgi:ABC-type phosphate transport system substrate-binding protein